MRIPIVMGAEPERQDAVLVEDGHPMPATGYAQRFVASSHIPGCACCNPRGPAAEALTRLFRDRAIGAAPFFHRVVVLASPSGEAAVREAVAKDVLTRARYRMD